MIKYDFFTRHDDVAREAVTMVNQVHGTDCLVVDQSYKGFSDADALVTKEKGVSLGIITADCAPVLLDGKSDDGCSVIGAVHAGWRGAFSGVCENTVQAMQSIGCQKETITVRVGPCIQQESYEVSEDFYKKFIVQTEKNDAFFERQGEKNNLYFDLSGYIQDRFLCNGLESVFVDGRDTYGLEEDFFSYRRATHQGVIEEGRQISTIMILND